MLLYNLNANGHCDLTPIVLLHGVNGSAKSMIPIKENLEKKCSGLYVKNIEIGNGKKDSFKNLWMQIEEFKNTIYLDDKLKQGFHIIAHSQGGLITRGFIEMYNHSSSQYKVYIFITLGSPHRGVDGLPEIDNSSKIFKFFDNHIDALAYTQYMQGHLSLAEMWNDPMHNKKFLENDIFIPIINNEVNHPLKETFKQNFLNLEKVVFFKSSQEDVVFPPDSCWMDFYIPETKEITPYSNTFYYLNDVLGIKTLEEQGKIFYPEVNCTHTNYRTDPEVFEIICDHLGYNSLLIPSAPPYTYDKKPYYDTSKIQEKKQAIINYIGIESFNEIYGRFLNQTLNDVYAHYNKLIQKSEESLSSFAYLIKKLTSLEKKLLNSDFKIGRFLKIKKDLSDINHLIRKTKRQNEKFKNIQDSIYAQTILDEYQLVQIIPQEIFEKKINTFLNKLRESYRTSLIEEIESLSQRRIFLRYNKAGLSKQDANKTYFDNGFSISQILKQKNQDLESLR